MGITWNSAKKVLQRQFYTVVSTRWGAVILFLCGVLTLNSVLHAVDSMFGTAIVCPQQNCLYDRSDNIQLRSFEDVTCAEPIDAVYTWVNGSDPKLLEEIARYQQLEDLELGGNESRSCEGHDGNLNSSSAPCGQHSQGASHPPGYNATKALLDAKEERGKSKSRYEDHDELRYSLRSLERFAGWVRRIFIVTNGQIPSWINTNHPKIRIVSHREIFRNESHLPVFASPAIEANLHRIPGLSRRFMYLNDDTFFGSPVTPDDFYTPSRGHKVYWSWPVPNCAEGCPANWIKDKFCDKQCNVSECEWDGGDCLLSPTSEHGGGGGDNHHYGFGGLADFCSSTCLDAWLGDRYCDQACNIAECGFDGGDCVTDDAVASKLLRLDLSHARTDFVVPFGTKAFYIDLKRVFPKGSKVVSGLHDTPSFVRSAAVSQKRKAMTITVLGTVTNPFCRFELDGKGADGKSRIFVQFNVTIGPKGQGGANNGLNKGCEGAKCGDNVTRREGLNSGGGRRVLQVRSKSQHHQMGSVTDMYSAPAADGQVSLSALVNTYGRENIDFGGTRDQTVFFGREPNRGTAVRGASKGKGTNGGTDNDAADSKTSRALDAFPSRAPRSPTRLDVAAMRLRKRVEAKKLVEAETTALQQGQGWRDALKAVVAPAEYERMKAEERDRLAAEIGNVPHLLEDLRQRYDGNLKKGDPSTTSSTRRRLLDLFGDSLKFVDKLMTAKFGRETRKVPAHMVHLIDTDVVKEMQDAWSDEFDATSASRFRSKHNMQYSFSHFYWIVHALKDKNPDVFFREKIDLNNNGNIDPFEARRVALLLWEKEMTREKMVEVLGIPEGGEVPWPLAEPVPQQQQQQQQQQEEHQSSSNHEGGSEDKPGVPTPQPRTAPPDANSAEPPSVAPSTSRKLTSAATGAGYDYDEDEPQYLAKGRQNMNSSAPEDGGYGDDDGDDARPSYVRVCRWIRVARGPQSSMTQAAEEDDRSEEEDVEAHHYKHDAHHDDYLDHDGYYDEHDDPEEDFDDGMYQVGDELPAGALPPGLSPLLAKNLTVWRGWEYLCSTMTEGFDDYDSMGEGYAPPPEEEKIRPLTEEFLTMVKNLLNVAANGVGVNGTRVKPSWTGMVTPLQFRYSHVAVILMELYKDHRYRFEAVELDDVTFFMIRDNATVVRNQMDHVLFKRPKFLCINDNMNHSHPDHPQVIAAVKELLNNYFPWPSSFELHHGAANPYWDTDAVETLATASPVFRIYRRTSLPYIVVLLSLGLCVYILYLNFESIGWRRRRNVPHDAVENDARGHQTLYV